jgi:long-chain fatty acid transport protein
MKRLHVTALLVGCATLAALGQAGAGGFSRGTADTDLIFEEGNFNMRASMTIVMPKRGYETLTAPTPGGALAGLVPGQSYASTDGDYTQTYAIPSMAVKFNLSDDFRCAGTYTQPFGADSEYGPQAILFGSLADGTGTISEGFDNDEFGATCGYKLDLAKGRAWLIAGGFLQDFSYSQTVLFNGTIVAAGLIAAGVPPLQAGQLGAALNNTDATLQFDGDYEPGYRIGLAYEIPEITLRAQIMYRSEVHHTPDGTFTTALDGPSGPAPAVGDGTLPQSVELKVQSGIAPGWLAFGSVRWTDWSVLDTLDYTILGGPLPGDRELEYFFKDGWTVTGGIGHAFSESISGVVGLTWDRGVSTTEDTLSDSYTAAAGVSIKDKLGGEVRFGGAISYLTSASVSAEAQPTGVGVVDQGASFGYSVGSDFVYALSAGYRIAW